MQMPVINPGNSSRTLHRAGEIFAEQRESIYRHTDRLFAVLMAIQWVAGILAALWVSPRTWVGSNSQTHIHVWAAIFLGGAINIVPIALAMKRPGAATTRYAIATAQMLMSALLISLTGGRIETHFHIFGSLAFLAFYRDWRVLVPATIVVAADHFLRGVFWPQSVYGVLSVSQWRWLEHAGWVLFEDAFLFIAIKRSVREMWAMAQRTAELNSNEERYRAVVEQTAEGLVLADVDTKRVLECNVAFAGLLGYTLEETLALTAYDFVVDEREAIDRRSGHLLDRRLPITGERRFRRKDDSIIDVEVNVTVIVYGGKDVFCTIVRDISERKRAEEALRESELRFRSVTHSANDAIVSVDSEGNIIFLNKGAENAFGYTGPEILGKPVTQLVPEEYRAAYAKGLERCLATGETRVIGKTVELSGLRKDGSVFPFELSLATWRTAQGKFVTGIFRDITERKQAEEALRRAHDQLETKVRERTAELAGANERLRREATERKLAEDALRDSEERYRLLFDSNPLPLWVYDVETLSFLAVNNAAIRNYGYSGEEFLTMTIADIRPAQDVPALLGRVAELGQTSNNTGKWRHRKKDGSVIEVEIVSHTLDFVGRPARIVLAIDITERERAERALDESRQWLSAIFDSSRDGIIVEENERIVYVNNSYAHLFGYESAELTGQPVQLVSEQEPSERMLEYSRRRMRGEEAPALYPFRGTKKDGTTVDLEASVSTAKIGEKSYIISLCRDITERKRMEDERQVISEIIQGVIATSDLNELLALVHHSIGKCLYAENCFVALYDEATDLMHFEFWVDKFDPCPSPRPIGVGFGSYVLRRGQPLLVDRELTEEMVRRGDVEQSGTMSASWLGVPLRTPTHTVGVLVVQHYEDENAYTSHDVDFLSSVGGQIALAIDRRRTEEDLDKQRGFLRQVIDLNPSFIFAKDREGRFTLVNQALAEAYGSTVEELLGKTDADFNANNEEVEWFQRDDVEVMDTGVEKFIPEEMITDASGNVRWLQTIKRPITSKNGTPKQILGVATDITERKKAEQALQDSEQQLRQAQKMESIGTLAGGIAHDFNNLMTAVTGYSELTLRSLKVDDPLRSKIEEIKRAGERAASLTRQLLAFSRKQILQPVVLDLNTVIKGMGGLLPRMIGEDIELCFELDVSLGQVKADPGQMEQVLMNLAVNARDAMPPGGCLTIKTENVNFGGKLVKRLLVDPGHYVMLSVSDNGCGMDAETQAHIFEPFFTTKEVGKGTGLGLSTVYGIVKQSGGSIWAYSELGQGTTFRIYLPRVDKVVETEESRDEATAAPRGHETILLVEDEDMVRALSKEILEVYGYVVIAAANGKEGLRICQEFKGDIDLMITDVVMPQMGGRELAENVGALRPDMRVLFMSGFTDDAVVRHGVLDDGMCFIQKPFSPDSLARKAREVLDHPRSEPGGNSSMISSISPKEHSEAMSD
jgi:two-component system, cell cycle sensor histidine kinase and response regulator CckA